MLPGVLPAVMLHQLLPVASGRHSHKSATQLNVELKLAIMMQVLVEAEEAARSRRLALSSESLTVDLRYMTG